MVFITFLCHRDFLYLSVPLSFIRDAIFYYVGMNINIWTQLVKLSDVCSGINLSMSPWFKMEAGSNCP